MGAGLPAPAAAAALLGPTGAIVMLILLFLAVTSATSAELVAVSSVITYDILPYFRPNATDKEMLLVDHIAIAATGLAMALLGTIFFYVGVSMGFLYELMGTLLGSAVIPVALVSPPPLSPTFENTNKRVLNR